MQSEESWRVTDNGGRIEPTKRRVRTEREVGPEDNEELETVTDVDIWCRVHGNPVEMSSWNLLRSSPFLGTFRWMCRFGGGGCREEFRSRVETDRKGRMDRVQRMHLFMGSCT